MTEEKLTLEGLLKETKEQPFMAAGFAVIVFVIFALVMEIFSMLLRGSLVNPDAVARAWVWFIIASVLSAATVKIRSRS